MVPASISSPPTVGPTNSVRRISNPGCSTASSTARTAMLLAPSDPASAWACSNEMT